MMNDLLSLPSDPDLDSPGAQFLADPPGPTFLQDVKEYTARSLDPMLELLWIP